MFLFSPIASNSFISFSFSALVSGLGLGTVDPVSDMELGLKSGGTVEAQPGHDQDISGRRFQLKAPYHVEPD